MKSSEPVTPTEPMRRVIPLRHAHERRGAELAFLPVALETPPSPIRRAIRAIIILLFCAALGWAWWGTIDIGPSDTGKIVPSGVRACVTDPRILIFDEATSALDYESERIIRQNMKEIAKGRAAPVTAHRLEDGPRDSLIKAGGRYASLHRLQAGIHEIL